MNPFEVFLTIPILNLLVGYYQALSAISAPGALGAAIILLTVTIRMILWPLTTTQLKSSQKMAALKPHLDRLKADHGHDKIRHQQEVTKLYKEHGVNPMAGCLPLLLQIPVFIALYNVLLQIVQVNGDFLGNINSKLYPFVPGLDQLPQTSFFGVSLSKKPSDWQTAGFLLLAIPLITGLLQYIQSKMLTPQKQLQKETALIPKPENQKDQKSDLEDTMSQMQSQMSLIMPAMIAFFSYGFPVGLSLYWNTFTIIGIIQQYLVAGPGALSKYLPKSWQNQNQK